MVPGTQKEPLGKKPQSFSYLILGLTDILSLVRHLICEETTKILESDRPLLEHWIGH